MFKACMTFLLTLTVLFGITTTNSEAKTKKKNNSAPISSTSKKNKNKKTIKKSKKNRKSKSTKSKRSHRSGTGPDLRALTTEKPFDEYIQNPDNGVNSVETKSEIE